MVWGEVFALTKLRGSMFIGSSHWGSFGVKLMSQPKLNPGFIDKTQTAPGLSWRDQGREGQPLCSVKLHHLMRAKLGERRAITFFSEHLALAATYVRP